MSLESRTRKLIRKPWVAYGTILALQLRIIWNVWRYRDISGEDTSHYYVAAWSWFTKGTLDLLWSPLYTLYYGSLLSISNDAYAVTRLHRIVIVLTASVLLLAVMRQLMPAGLAWLIAVWSCVLPANYDAMYAVHQFAVLPILLIALVALRGGHSKWMRGAV